MADVHSKKVRSYNMSMIKSKNTKPELIVRKFLRTNRIRFRTQSKKLPGKPDFVLPELNTVIFVHGCFWHGHKGCKYFVVPKTRTAWWLEKINSNIARDKKNILSLKKSGWKIIHIWECKLKPNKLSRTFSSLSNFFA